MLNSKIKEIIKQHPRLNSILKFIRNRYPEMIIFFIIIFAAIFIFKGVLYMSNFNQNEFEYYISDIGIDFHDKYKINSIENGGIRGDWSLKAHIQVSDNDKRRIINILKNKYKFQKVKSREEFYENYYKKEDSIFGYVFESKYYYYEYYIRYEKKSGGYYSKAGSYSYALEFDTLSNKLYFDNETD